MMEETGIWIYQWGEVQTPISAGTDGHTQLQNPSIMKRYCSPLLLSFIGVAAALPAWGELPTLDEKAWAGTFAGFESRSLRFQFLTDGAVVVHPLFKDRQSYPYIRIPVQITLEESLADGSTKLHPVLPESLETSDKATAKLKRSTVSGRFEGGAAFNLTLADKSGVVILDGSLTDPGDFKGKNVRLRIAAEILNFYGRDEKELANDPKAFGELVSKSSLNYTTTDRKQTKLDFSQSFASGSTMVTGVREAAVEFAPVGPKTFEFEATGESALRLEPRLKGPLHRGFFVIWSPGDGAGGKDATFMISVK